MVVFIITIIIQSMKDNIYGLWQSDHHKLAISYKHIRKRGNIDWQVVQDGKDIIYATRTRSSQAA